MHTLNVPQGCTNRGARCLYNVVPLSIDPRQQCLITVAARGMASSRTPLYVHLCISKSEVGGIRLETSSSCFGFNTKPTTASAYWYMREKQKGTVSSNSRFLTVLSQQYPANLSREFTKRGLVKGGLAISVFPLCNCNAIGPDLNVQIETCLIAKPPFTEPPFVNSRLS